MILHTRIPAIFGAQAMTIAPWLVLVLPTRSWDTALIAHEQVHARQQREHGWRRGGFLGWWVCYLASRSFRQRMEVAAYRVQIRHGADLDGCARNLAKMYRLRLDVRTARMLLS